MSSSDPPSDQEKTENKTQPTDIKESIAALASSFKDFVEEYKTNNRNQATADHTKETWNRRTAKGVFVYTGLTAVIMGVNYCQLKTSKDTFDATERPYVGVSNVGVTLYKDNGDVPMDTREATIGRFVVEIKNFGLVPATNYSGNWRVYIDGVQVPVNRTAPDDGRTTIFPNGVTYIWDRIDGADFLAIQQKRKILRFEIPFSYDGPGHHYTGCEVDQYNPPKNEFLLGPSCTTPTTMDKQETSAKRPEWPNR
jgi:hypothetical protein